MIREEIFSLLDFNYENKITILKSEKVYAELNNGNAYVGGPDKSSLARAFTLFAHEYKKRMVILKSNRFLHLKTEGLCLIFPETEL